MLREDTFKKCEELDIQKLYESGKTFLDLQKEYHISYSVAKEFLTLKGVQIREDKKREELREKPIIGQRFGSWTVISDKIKVGNNRALYWNVRCDCGYETFRQSNCLKQGKTKSCRKCAANNHITDHYVKAIMTSKYNSLVKSLSYRKKVGKLEFNITIEDLIKLYNQSQICSLSGIDISLDRYKSVSEQNLSIDRIDSNKGYIKGNIQLVDKRINMMKGSLSNEEFIELCKKVINFKCN